MPCAGGCHAENCVAHLEVVLRNWLKVTWRLARYLPVAATSVGASMGRHNSSFGRSLPYYLPMGGGKGRTASSVGRKGRPIAASWHPLTFGRVADQFFVSQKPRLSAASQIRLKSMIKRFNAFFCEATILSSISEGQVRDFVRQRSREAAPGSLRLELGALKRIFRMAVDNDVIKKNPALPLSVPREKVETHYLTQYDLRRVLGACPEWLKPIVQFCVGTGLSRQELLRVRWADVEETNGEMFLCVSQGKSERKIPLNDLAKHALQLVRPESDHSKGLIFRGESVTSANISQAFMRACRLAGMSGVSFKDLRHTSALWMRQEGVPLGTIANFLGHANAQTAARYLQGEDAVLDKAVRAIDRIANRPRRSIKAERR
jgi:integrase